MNPAMVEYTCSPVFGGLKKLVHKIKVSLDYAKTPYLNYISK